MQQGVNEVDLWKSNFNFKFNCAGFLLDFLAVFDNR